jgi:hypothetical protein
MYHGWMNTLLEQQACMQVTGVVPADAGEPALLRVPCRGSGHVVGMYRQAIRVCEQKLVFDEIASE